MSRRLQSFATLCAASACALAALWFGIAIPSFFRSVAPVVLATVGSTGPSAPTLARQFVDSGDFGVADAILQATRPTLPNATQSRQLLDARLAANPILAFTGGTAPFFQAFIEAAEAPDPSRPFVMPNLLRAQHRQVLNAFLAESLNANVARILETRTLSNWQVFLPVFSQAGQPLDAAILTTALLEQSRAFHPQLRSEILAAINAQNPNAIEPFFAALLSLGNRLNWAQLAHICQFTPSLDAFLFAAASTSPPNPDQPAATHNPRRLFALIAALAIAPDQAQALFTYLRRFDDRAWNGVFQALNAGAPALNTLLALNKPPYAPPAFWSQLPHFVTVGQSHFMTFAARFPNASLGLRALAFGIAGAAIALAFRSLFSPAGPHRRRLLTIDSLLGAILISALVWVVIEPDLLQFEPNRDGALRINFAAAVPEPPSSDLDNTTNPSNDHTMFDQVTLIVLALFFVLQLTVFVFCLLKIAEIRRQPVSPTIKLHLLDNEENLFDLGLYVGLGGTVFSLIMVVLKFVDASLMAAYASTLFGIIFVATLKIGFLRPFRRRLILDSNGFTL